MRISSIKVENYARLEDLQVSVGKHVVIIGPNSVGKSSLLRCMDWALGASMARLYSDVSLGDFKDPKQPLVVQIECSDLQREDKAAFADASLVDPPTADPRVIIEMRAEADDDGTLTITRGCVKPGYRRALSRDQISQLGWKMLPALSPQRDLQRGRVGIIDEILSGADLSAESAAFEAVDTLMRDTLRDSAAVTSLRSELSAKLQQILDARLIGDSVRLAPANSVENALAGTSIFLATEGGERTLYEQSDGIRALTALALHDLKNSAASMIAIDEPEIHLHPGSQRALGKLLATGGAQKVIATHSADIVAEFEPSSIIAVSKGGKLRQCDSFWTEYEKQFAQWWIRDRLEPLSAHHIIAVEGVADRIIVEKCAEVTGRSLDRLGVCVVEADGCNNMGAIWKLFGPSGFSSNLHIIIDDDGAVRAICSALNIEAKDFPAYGIALSRRDLEDEYIRALGVDAVTKALPSHFKKGELEHAKVRVEDKPNADSLRNFCGSNAKKVAAAMCVSQIITEESARKMSSIETVLNRIAPA